MITLYEITPTQNAAYDVYSFLLLLENQFKNVRISFFLNKEVNTHLSVLINQLKELQLHYKGLAGDFIPPAVPQNLRRYSR